MTYKNEWTQKEFLQNKRDLQKEGIEVILVDTILSPIEKANSVTYNPFELKQHAPGTVFVFYCDTGKATLDRLNEYKAKFPEYTCISLRGGRGYWRKNMMLLDGLDNDK
jgi:hypothetical protein